MSKIKTVPVRFTAPMPASRPAVETRYPVSYRLVKRGDEYVLQGAYNIWVEGRDCGADWRDLPTIEEARHA